MGFLDSAKALGEKALEKGKDVAEISKAKIGITEAESSIKKILVEIANDILVNHPEILETNYADKLAQINEFKAKIAELEAQIAAVKAD